MSKHPNRRANNNLSNLAYQSLKAMIISGEIPHNKGMVERVISDKLGMSRTPVRHALSRLQQEGLVRIVPQSGVFPVKIGYAEYQNILAVREVLEGLAARLATDHVSNAKLRELRAIFESIGDISDLEKVSHKDYALANVRYHREILELSNNPKLIQTMEGLYDHLSLLPLRAIEITERRMKSMEEHEEVLQALEQRDADRAEQAMRAHIRSLRKDIEEKFNENPEILEGGKGND